MPGKVSLPTIFLDQEWWVSGLRPKQILSQKFATVLSDEDFSNFDCRVVQGFISRPRMPASMKASGTSEWKISDGEFKIAIELDEFEKEDINVTRKGRYIEICAEHKEKRDRHGLVSREFCRRFRLPNNCDVDGVAASFSTDYKLTITAPIIPEEPGMYDEPRLLRLGESEYNPSRTEIDHEEFVEVQETCKELYDDFLQTDRMKVELENFLSERDVDNISLDEFRQWYLQKMKEIETETDVEIQEHREILDGIVREAHGMFSMDTGSPKPPVEPSGTGSPKPPVEPKAVETEESIQQ